MHLYIRADGNGIIGTGHIMRSIALAQAWKDQGGEVTFISRCESDALKERIQNEGCRFIALREICPNPGDLKNTLSILENDGGDQGCWLVLDGYHFTPSYHQAIRDEGYRLLVIDDMNHLPHYHADILLNQNIHAPDLSYRCDRDTTQLLGTRYMLLRREFLGYKDFHRRIRDRVKNILVTLGGADPDNVTLKVIAALILLNEPDIAVKIVIGPANPHQENLYKALDHASFEAELLINPPNIPELMAWADMAISAGGSTCWELAFMALPSIILVLADNQAAVADYLMKKKAAVNLGYFSECAEERICEVCRSMIESASTRKSLSRHIVAMVDKTGPNLVIRAMNQKSLTLRGVTDLDRELIWHWANDEETRKASYSQAHIPWDEHMRWFDAVRRQESHRFYIAANGGNKPVGQVRFAGDDKETIVSLNVAPEARRQGYGREILIKAARKLFGDTNIEQISAYVKSENRPSMAAFQKAGFCLEEGVVFNGVKSCKMILRRPERS